MCRQQGQIFTSVTHAGKTSKRLPNKDARARTICGRRPKPINDSKCMTPTITSAGKRKAPPKKLASAGTSVAGTSYQETRLLRRRYTLFAACLGRHAWPDRRGSRGFGGGGGGFPGVGVAASIVSAVAASTVRWEASPVAGCCLGAASTAAGLLWARSLPPLRRFHGGGFAERSCRSSSERRSVRSPAILSAQVDGGSRPRLRRHVSTTAVAAASFFPPPFHHHGRLCIRCMSHLDYAIPVRLPTRL